jgi:hypothetical protein
MEQLTPEAIGQALNDWGAYVKQARDSFTGKATDDEVRDYAKDTNQKIREVPTVTEGKATTIRDGKFVVQSVPSAPVSEDMNPDNAAPAAAPSGVGRASVPRMDGGTSTPAKTPDVEVSGPSNRPTKPVAKKPAPAKPAKKSVPRNAIVDGVDKPTPKKPAPAKPAPKPVPRGAIVDGVGKPSAKPAPKSPGKKITGYEVLPGSPNMARPIYGDDKSKPKTSPIPWPDKPKTSPIPWPKKPTPKPTPKPAPPKPKPKPAPKPAPKPEPEKPEIEEPTTPPVNPEEPVTPTPEEPTGPTNPETPEEPTTPEEPETPSEEPKKPAPPKKKPAPKPTPKKPEPKPQPPKKIPPGAIVDGLDDPKKAPPGAFVDGLDPKPSGPGKKIIGYEPLPGAPNMARPIYGDDKPAASKESDVEVSGPSNRPTKPAPKKAPDVEVSGPSNRPTKPKPKPAPKKPAAPKPVPRNAIVDGVAPKRGKAGTRKRIVEG